MSPLMVPNFSLILEHTLVFTVDIAKCVKRSRRKENNNLAACMLEITKVIFFKFGM